MMDETEKRLSDASAALLKTPSVSALSVVRTLSSAAIAILFSLYAIGFVIINSFLGRFGLRAGAVFTFDYVAAALCYLIFIAAVVGPMWIIYFGIMQWARSKQPGLSNWLWATVIVWIGLIFGFRQLYFPEPAVPVSGWLVPDTIILSIGGLHILLLVILWKTGKAAKLRAALKNELFFPAYLLALPFTSLMREPNLDGHFVFSALVLVGSGTVFLGTGVAVWDLKEHLKRWEIRVMLAVFYVCLLLGNASQFGGKQYAELPATVGGGRPVSVMVKSGLVSADNGQPLRLPMSEGVIGPVLLLYETSAEICLITNEGFAKLNGAAVQIKRDLVEWIVANPQTSPTPTSTPTPTASVSPANSSADGGQGHGSPTPPAPTSITPGSEER